MNAASRYREPLIVTIDAPDAWVTSKFGVEGKSQVKPVGDVG